MKRSIIGVKMMETSFSTRWEEVPLTRVRFCMIEPKLYAYRYL